MIETSGLTKRFGDFEALSELNISIPTGEITGFLGPNGAGKTTAMRILTCTTSPDCGSATVAGFDVVDQPDEVRKRIGFMPENAPLYPDMTVTELLNFVARIKAVESADHVESVITQTGLDSMRGKLVAHLSRGFRQRAALAQALIGDPEILILDEPTSGLDPHQIVEIRELIRDLRGHRTVLLSSHQLDEVARICSKVLIIDKGKLVVEVDPLQVDGTLEDLFLRSTSGGAI
ncbi:MAG: ABC transporter ATP-binding protein [bacterium]|nr:ABC transporter ATP-binding protein [bacterium]MCP4798619.1 ABC transporter ATP-binding protein [bacterium]